MTRTYIVGLAVGNRGLNQNQRVELGLRLAFIAKHVGEDGVIALYATRRDLRDLQGEPHEDVNQLRYKARVQLRYLPSVSADVASVFADLRQHCDEVWLCPGEGQETHFSKHWINKLRKMAQAQPLWAAKFKVIPVWTPLPDSETSVKAMKGKKR